MSVCVKRMCNLFFLSTEREFALNKSVADLKSNEEKLRKEMAALSARKIEAEAEVTRQRRQVFLF